MGLNFVCGLDQPEDLVQIGASKWIVASGMGDHGGIFLIDSDAKTARRFFTGAAKADLKRYPDCAAAPANFNSHGMALRPASVAGTYTLYSVTHLPFESIQVFAVDARGAEPAISLDRLRQAAGRFQVQCRNRHAGRHHPDRRADAWRRHRLHQRQYHRRRVAMDAQGQEAGVCCPAPNWPATTASRFRRMRQSSISRSPAPRRWRSTPAPTPANRRARIKTPWYNLDNIHWSGDRLIAAGMMFDEPACGGTRKQIQDAHGNMNCHRGWVVSQLDPKAMTLEDPGLWRAQSRLWRHRHRPGDRRHAVDQLVPDGPCGVPDLARPEIGVLP